jgi:branched-chain amino acid aminotransferase
MSNVAGADGRVWLNGVILAVEDARIDPADRGFTLGDGIFETICAIAGNPTHLPRHLARLRAGAKILGIEIPATDTILAAALTSIADGRDCALRLTLTRGPMPRGVIPSGPSNPTILITAAPLPAASPPLYVIIARSTRRNQHSPLARIKSLNYGDAILARQEAAARGAGDAILLNSEGNLAEATAANIILLLHGKLLTPRVEDGALPGVTRARLIEAGLVTEACLTPDDAAHSSAAVVTNSLGIRSLCRLGARDLDPQHPSVLALTKTAVLF